MAVDEGVAADEGAVAIEDVVASRVANVISETGIGVGCQAPSQPVIG